LAYLRDRLVVARELLTDTGSIFVQIGDDNVHFARALMDEIFGAENFVACINFQTMTPLESGRIENVFDYLLWYAKDGTHAKYRNLYVEKRFQGNAEFRFYQNDDGSFRTLTAAELLNLDKVDASRIFKRSALESSGFTPSCVFPFKFEGQTFLPRGGKSWRTNREGMDSLARQHRLFVLGSKLYFKLYFQDFAYTSLVNTWTDTVGGFADTKVYVVQTHPKIIQRCVLMTTDPGDLVLDPTCGSGTMAYVAEQWGRRWITCDTSRVAIALARTRLMSGRFPYYLLADSVDGAKKEADLTGRTPPGYKPSNDVRQGFVLKRVPHVTLKSVANNPDIREGMDRDKIDEAILRHAELELLVDKPYEDPKRLRVSGPFTVESLSPHRVLTTDEDRPASESEGKRESESTSQGTGDFATMILENLRKAGIQNTRKDERLVFDRLDPHAGRWVHATGEFKNAAGKTQRVAVSIGPEHGTVGPMQVKEAAKEAVQGLGHDLLCVCGLAFDPHVAEEKKRYGKLVVWTPRINADLTMGDEVLKKTGAGNLFMEYGEPDIEVRREAGQLVVDIRGVDVYDPTTGEIRNSSVDDIACWFIDTDYNGESFFVRQAYFLGKSDDEGPYDKLKRALRAEVDEAAWSALYSSTSRPFPAPESSKIAVKVINHYGDEVLKVYST